MNRRGMLGLVGAFALTAVIGGAAAVKPKATKVASGCCGQTCCCAAGCNPSCCNLDCCGDNCCCNFRTESKHAVKSGKDESRCEDDAKAGSACKGSQCADTADVS
jgi:hypothetical protein